MMDDAEILMEMGLDKSQALQTLILFPDMEDALEVVRTHRHPPKGMERYVGDYFGYLETLKNAALGESGDKTDYDLEVEERTTLVQRQSELSQRHYRDRPWNSEHFYEHLASQEAP